MKIKKSVPFVWVIVASVVLVSCSSSNQFASSFGKRKYMKGYYTNSSGSEGSVATSNPHPSPSTVTPAVPAPVNNSTVAEQSATKKTAAAVVPVVPSKSGEATPARTTKPISSNNILTTDPTEAPQGNAFSSSVIDNDASVNSYSGSSKFDWAHHKVAWILCGVLLILIIVIFVATGGQGWNSRGN